MKPPLPPAHLPWLGSWRGGTSERTQRLARPSCWLLIFCLLTALVATGWCASSSPGLYGSVFGPADQIVPINGATGPLNYSQPYLAPSIRAYSSNETLVPNANVVLGSNANGATITVTPTAGQNGQALITIVAEGSGDLASCDFVVEVPMAVSKEGGTLSSSNLATRGTAFAKDVLPDSAEHSVAHLNDGIYGDANSWIGNSANTFAGISFGSRPVPINQIAFGRDNTGVAGSDRAGGLFIIEYTTVPNPNAATAQGDWIRIGSVYPPFSANPGLRHVIPFPTVMATGVRLFMASSGLGIDELELYNITAGPMVIAPDDQLIALHASTQVLPFTTSEEPPSLTVTASSSNPSFIPNANILLGGNPGHRTVKMTPVPNGAGVAIITLRVSDGTQTATDQFTVRSIVPTVVAPADQGIQANSSTAVLPFTTTSELSVTASSSNPFLVPDTNIVLGGSAGNRTIQVTPTADRSGVAVITLTVSDGVQSASAQFTVYTLLNLLKEGGSFRSGNLATGGLAFAKDVIAGYPGHTIAHLNDGIYGNANSWIPNGPNSFAGINLGGTALPINCVALGRDNTGVALDRVGDRFILQYTTVPNPDANTPDANWITIGPVEPALFGLPASRHLFSFPEVNATGVRLLSTTSETCIDELEIYHEVPAIGAPSSLILYQQPDLGPMSTAALPYLLSKEPGLSVTASSSNQALVPNANIVLGGGRTVTVSTVANQAGSATITLTVSNGTQSSTDSFVVTVVPVVNYFVGDSASLAAAILSANASAPSSAIRLTANITLSASLPFLYRPLMVDGGGFAINGAGYRAFVVGDAGTGSFTPEVTIKDLTIYGAKGVGGDSLPPAFLASGGGGGAGLGGALFVSRGATVHLSNVNFASNEARGGSAGIGLSPDQIRMGTAGGSGVGLGFYGSGGDGTSYAGFFSEINAGGAGGLGFGGGGGGSAAVNYYPTSSSEGYGGYGGGGGGDGELHLNYGFSPGFGAGSGFQTYGGGGAALGGAVFIQVDGKLTIAGGLAVSANSVIPGHGYFSGSGFGSGFFGHGTNTLTFSPESAEMIQTVQDDIADEVGSSGGGIGATGRLSVLKNGPGTTILSGANTYAGSTSVQAGRLLLTGSNSNAINNEATFGAYGIAATGSYTQSATGIFQVRFGSDRLDAYSVSLNGKLDLVVAPGAPAGPTTIIRTGGGPIVGTFSGLPEGSRFVNNGNIFQISYVGGAGNDVVVTLRPPFEAVTEGGTATPANLASRGTAFAKDLIPGYPDRHTIPHLNDGIYGNENSWIGNSANSFAGISFGTRAIAINQVAFGRDNTGVESTRAISVYTVQYTTAPNPDENTPDGSWINIGTIDTGTLANPALRHLFNFPTLMATGIRVITAVDGTDIDELEVYNAIDGLQVVAPDDQTLAANSSTGALLFTTSAASGLTFSASSEDPALIPNANIILGGTAGRPTVAVTPVIGRYGSAAITLTVSDGTQIATDRFVVSVVQPYTVLGGPGFVGEADNSNVGNVNLALQVNGGTAFAKDVIAGYAAHKISHLNDGLYGNAYSWIAATRSSFAGINLGSLKKINRVSFGRDNTLVQDDHWEGYYTLQYTTAPNPEATTTQWRNLGVVDLSFGGIYPKPSIKQHSFSFPPVLATGVRILTEANPISPDPMGIDELEVYNLPGPDIVVEQTTGEPLMHGFSTVDFGEVAAYSAWSIVLTISNRGSADLVLGSVSKTGADMADFTIGLPSQTTIAPGSSAKLRLTFMPGALGSRNAKLSIASNAVGSKAPFVLNLTATGILIPIPPTGISSGLTLVETGGTFGPDNLAPEAVGGSAFASGLLPGDPQYTIAHLNDGLYGNVNSWIGDTGYAFGGIRLSGLKPINSIAFGRNNLIPQIEKDRAVGLYAIQYTTVSNPDATTTDWTTIGNVDLANSTLFGTETSGGPAQRHRFSFTPVMATGVRILAIPDGTAIDEIEVYEYFTPQEQWRRKFFNTPANSDAAADGADPDHDGENNLFEFATGQDPTLRSHVAFQQTRTASAVVLTYTRSLAAVAGGVTFTVEICDDLVAGVWSTVGVGAPVVLSDDGSVQQVQVTVPTPSSVRRRFARLTISN